MKMKRCRSCGEYTLKEVCPHCGGRTGIIYPPKFSPEDKYGVYRRKLKREIYSRGSGELK